MGELPNGQLTLIESPTGPREGEELAGAEAVQREHYPLTTINRNQDRLSGIQRTAWQHGERIAEVKGGAVAKVGLLVDVTPGSPLKDVLEVSPADEEAARPDRLEDIERQAEHNEAAARHFQGLIDKGEPIDLSLETLRWRVRQHTRFAKELHGEAAEMRARTDKPTNKPRDEGVNLGIGVDKRQVLTGEPIAIHGSADQAKLGEGESLCARLAGVIDVTATGSVDPAPAQTRAVPAEAGRGDRKFYTEEGLRRTLFELGVDWKAIAWPQEAAPAAEPQGEGYDETEVSAAEESALAEGPEDGSEESPAEVVAARCEALAVAPPEIVALRVTKLAMLNAEDPARWLR